MEFVCPACRQLLESSADLADQQAICPACRCDLIVPPPGSAGRQLVVAEEAPVHFRRRLEDAEAEMDMTPMVDVTFLLLIFFMVTAAFVLQKSFQIPPPEEEKTTQAPARSLRELEQDPDYVLVRVDRHNTYFVTAAHWESEREVTSLQDLLVQLREARQVPAGQRVPARLLVVANGEAQHQYVVGAMDAGNEVGMQDVILVSVEDEAL